MNNKTKIPRMTYRNLTIQFIIKPPLLTPMFSSLVMIDTVLTIALFLIIMGATGKYNNQYDS